jgi:hypothetical protein
MTEENLIKLEFVETFNWKGALRGMRNPLESWDLSDSEFKAVTYSDCNFISSSRIEPLIGEKDYDLCKRLIKAGSDHRKFLRQISISFDLTCAWGIWKEYATYKVGTVENSTSQMHKLGSRELNKDDFSIDTWDDVTKGMLKDINARITCWKVMRDNPDTYSPDTIKQAWRDMIQIIPASFLYKRTCTLNYEVLMNIYNARKNHKQREWHEFLNKLLDNIPYPEFITGDFK